MGNAPTYQLLIVGAGPVGSVVAEQAAARLGWRSLIVEKRDHIAGNCYDSVHPCGVMIHNYGPHYFRTDRQDILDYLSRFTDWIDGNYIVRSEVGGTQYPFPINLDTLEQFFGCRLNAASAKALLEKERVQIEQPANSEEYVLSRVGKRLFEAFYEGYTQKMWDRSASELDPSVCGRIPVKLDRDPYYTTAAFRRFPKEGYTALFQRMIDHPLIDLRLQTDYFQIKQEVVPEKATIYTGPIDRYFDHCHGPLEWRSLQFEFEQFDRPFVQECVQVNYPDARPHTRTVEIKHVTRQEHASTVLCTETPVAKGPPFYPVPDRANRERYGRYKKLAGLETAEKNVYFAGRLAEYTYINMDQAVARGLQLVDMLAQGKKG